MRRAALEPENAPGKPVTAWRRGERASSHTSKYLHYLFVVSILVAVLSALGLLNAYLHFLNLSSYNASVQNDPDYLLLAGYLGMFLTILVSPVPDYILLPVYGYLSFLGLFNPVWVFIVCVAAVVMPIEYAAGRFAARPLLLRGLSVFRIREKDIENADDWIFKHGKFSVFISTFVPFFYSVVALAAGTLRMGAAAFLLNSIVGFGVRYAFLEYVGYYGVGIFSYSFDYSARYLFAALLLLCAPCAAAYLLRVLPLLVRRRSGPSKASPPR
jgi:membrane protein DedA with SNARE-associated domain